MKNRMKKFLTNLIDTNSNRDVFGCHEHNYELDMCYGAVGPDAPEAYYYFWDSSVPLSIITAMRSYVAREQAYNDSIKEY